MILLDDRDIEQVLTAEMTLAALEKSYRDLVEHEAVCRPRIDIRIPTAAPGRVYQWGTRSLLLLMRRRRSAVSRGKSRPSGCCRTSATRPAGAAGR